MTQVFVEDNADKKAQEEFNRRYITSSEIVRELGISRPALLEARRRGQLPGVILINESQIAIWERDAIRPHLDAWKQRRLSK